MRRILLAFLTMLLSFAGLAQDHWTPVTESALGRNPFVNKNRPSEFRLFTLNETGMKAALQNAPSESRVAAGVSSFTLIIPDETGKAEQFRIVEASIMEPGLSAKFPESRSYAGVSVTDPTTTIRFSYGRYGFSGVVLTTTSGIRFIERLNRNENLYVVALQSDLQELAFDCTTIGQSVKNQLPARMAAKNADDSKLRIYRLALAANWLFSAEYSNSLDPEATQKADVMDELNEQMTIVNALFERDFGARLVMIENNEDIIYLDDTSDPFPNGDPGSDPINNQAQSSILII